VVEDFANSNTILDCNMVTAKIYGTIKQKLKIKGHPISENDIWIAALARQHNMILVTRDKDFEAVDDLTLESW
jgi:tRNA(fMet)-specific endonuclease VapC